ncbi:hypothetical protein HanRHA438_Chr16g0744761 [Helianthus annuus]|nr:hypothetical protein HanRHA438_Chr16g0744761 [Helianthus annuus]
MLQNFSTKTILAKVFWVNPTQTRIKVVRLVTQPARYRLFRSDTFLVAASSSSNASTLDKALFSISSFSWGISTGRLSRIITFSSNSPIRFIIERYSAVETAGVCPVYGLDFSFLTISSLLSSWMPLE